MSKKSQITIYIIIGVVIVAFAGLLFYMRSSSVENLQPDEQPEMTKQSLASFVSACITKEAPPMIKQLAAKGGLLSPGNSVKYFHNDYRYLCINDPRYEMCVPLILTRQQMEENLGTNLRTKLQSCIDLDRFREQGIQVTAGGLDVKTVIADEQITIQINYPISMSQNGATVEVSEFIGKVDLPLGKLFRLALDIMNEEVTAKVFDQDAWMVNNGAEVIIYKHNPYPDTVYSLSKPNRLGDVLLFNFALQGRETIRDLGFATSSFDIGGCCQNTYDSTCYSNAVESDCSATPGTVFSPNVCDCALPKKTEPAAVCDGEPCKSCEQTWDYNEQDYVDNPKKHGESWCVFDGPVGQGFDYVGTRHYKHTCIDGKEYVEECRDYREGLCAEERYDDNTTKAVCRPNRWHTCSSQTDKQSCEDTTFRDCQWTEELVDEEIRSYGMQRDRQCHPAVPPGFKHWEMNGLKVCMVANEWRHCDGVNCPDAWNDALAQYCYFQGDCGNYRNVADRITKYGWVSTDNRARDVVYLDDGLTANGLVYKTGLPVIAPEYPPLTGEEFANPGHSAPELMDAGREYFEEAASWNINDFLWQYMSDGEVDFYVFGAGICGPWQASPGGQCGFCNNYKFKPCTEYKCKSLGQGCIYEVADGVGRCTHQMIGDTGAPTVKFDDSLLTPGYESVETEFLGYSGIEITPALALNKRVMFGFRTSEPAQCVITPLPASVRYYIPSAVAGISPIVRPTNYSWVHNIAFNVVEVEEAYDRILEAAEVIGVDKIEGFVDIVDRYTEVLESFGEKYGIDVSSQIGGLQNSIITEKPDLIKEMIKSAALRKYRVFVKCSDRRGNTNEEELFVYFSIQEKGEDTMPPRILNSTPATGANVSGQTLDLEITADELVECRYNILAYAPFQDASFPMKCPPSVYALNADGTYTCKAKVDTSKFLPGETTPLFVECRDNPPRFENYAIKLSKGPSLALLETNALMNKNILLEDPSTVRILSPNVLRGAVKQVTTPTNAANIVLNATNSVCKFSTKNDIVFDKMESMICTADTCQQQLVVNNQTYFIKCHEITTMQRNTASYFLGLIKEE